MKLDIGCGSKAEQGWIGVDIKDFGQQFLLDVRQGLPFADETVREVRCVQFVEHLTGAERIGFFNELYRVMRPGAKATVVTPDFSHAAAYGDPTHQWPPLSFAYVLYLDRNWRELEAPHVDYRCDFASEVGCRPDEHGNDDFSHHCNSWRDLVVTLTKR